MEWQRKTSVVVTSSIIHDMAGRACGEYVADKAAAPRFSAGLLPWRILVNTLTPDLTML